MGDLIPPAVIDVAGNDSSFIATLSKDTALLAKWASTDTQTMLGANSDPFQTTLATVKTELLDLAKQVTDAKLGADATPFWTDITALRTAVDAMSPLDINVDANISEALAEIAVLHGALASAETGGLASAAGGGGGGGGSAGLLGLLGGGGGSGGGGGLMSLLGFGTGALGTAGLGTLGSLMGGGIESLLTTALGVAGSGAGALAGGGALGLGSLGVAGVGMGTDLAGIGQASGDIKTTYTNLTALNAAIQQYGANSTQAATAQSTLTAGLQSFSPAAQTAVLAAAQTAVGFHAMFDSVTGAAEKTGAQIINQLMQVGEKFLPTIGQFASQNMTIIQSSLQPLFSWIQGPGLSIFKELEKTFQNQLPTAMVAFDNGIELVIRVLGFLAPYTGRLIDDMAKWMTELNGADFSKLTHGINSAIVIFRDWEALIKAVGTAIYELFTHDAGTGTSIVVSLTAMINKFNAWVKTVSGGDALHSLLESHKAEILAIIQVLGHLIASWGQVELTVRPVLMDMVTLLADVINFLFEIPGVGKIMAIVIAFEIFGSHIGLLSGLLNAFNNKLKNLALGGLSALANTAPIQALTGGLTSAGAALRAFMGLTIDFSTTEDGATVATAGFSGALVVLQGVGILAVAVGIYELIEHFGALRGLMIAGAAAVMVLAAALIFLDSIPVVALVVAIGLAIVGLIAGIVYLATHWSQVWNEVKSIIATAVAFVRSHLNMIAIALAALGGPFGLLIAAALELAAHWRTVWTTVESVTSDVASALTPIIQGIVGVITAAWSVISGITKAVWDLISGIIRADVALIEGAVKVGMALITGNWTAAWNALTGMFQGIWGDIRGAVMEAVSSLASGVEAAWHGLVSSIQLIWAGAVSWFNTIKGDITGVFSDAGTWLLDVGKAIIQGLINGIDSMIGALTTAVGKVGSTVKSVVTLGGLIGSPSPYFTEVGQMIGLGLANGVTASAGLPTAAVSRMAAQVKSVPFGTPALAGTTGAAGSGLTVSPTYHVTIYGGNAQQISTSFEKVAQEHTDDLIRRLSAGTISSARG